MLLALTVYSYGFVDPNLHKPLFDLVFNNRPLSTIIFISIILLLTICYLLFLRLAVKKNLNIRRMKWLIGLTIGILIFSYPAFSYDIFNYILTAKVTYFYHENPYLVMPIEFIDDPNLAWTRAANKIALYGPSWIALTAMPHSLSFNNIVLSIFNFKLLIILFYLASLLLIYRLSKNILPVALFAFNPVVLVETLVSSHNDIVMMFLSILSFYFLTRKRVVLAGVILILSILIKYATIILVPIFLFAAWKIRRKEKIILDNIFHLSGWAMLIIFLTAPIREEIYPWYVIWMLSFAVLTPKKSFLLSLIIVLSVATLLRYVPVLYTGSYFGMTPIIKELVTFIPVGVVFLFWLYKKFIWQKNFR